ncbi:MAG: TRAM domain-containing protein [Candidatus Omnitrophota bacterium]
MKKEQHEIEIYGLAYGGSGVGKLDGKICFVEGALPGEKVLFVKNTEKKNFTIGCATQILTASNDRVKPECPHYGKCGGCQYQHLNYEKEVSYKKDQVREILARIGGFTEYKFQKIIPAPCCYNYRSSITLHRSKTGLGFFARDNETIIDITECPLVRNEINAAIDTLSKSGRKDDITIKSDKKGSVWIEGLPGHRFFKDEFLGTELTFSPLAFSQGNREIALSMAEQLRTWIKEEEDRSMLFDLYCGVGFFGMLLRDLFKSVIGIDNSRVAIDCASSSKKDLKANNIKFYRSETDEGFPEYYEKFKGKTNTILLDPPRSGINKTIAKQRLGLKDARTLYYISCDPAKLARDAKLFTQDKIWTLDRVVCFDMFPRTKHIESIALFKR